MAGSNPTGCRATRVPSVHRWGEPTLILTNAVWNAKTAIRCGGHLRRSQPARTSPSGSQVVRRITAAPLRYTRPAAVAAIDLGKICLPDIRYATVIGTLRPVESNLLARRDSENALDAATREAPGGWRQPRHKLSCGSAPPRTGRARSEEAVQAHRRLHEASFKTASVKKAMRGDVFVIEFCLE